MMKKRHEFSLNNKSTNGASYTSSYIYTTVSEHLFWQQPFRHSSVFKT